MTNSPAHILTTEKGLNAFMAVLDCMDTWQRLTPIQRHILTTETPAMAPRTRTALTSRGLWDKDGITPYGRSVAHYGPLPRSTGHSRAAHDHGGQEAQQ